VAKAIDKISLILDLKGFSKISGLGKDFEKLKSTVQLTEKGTDKFINSLRQIRKETALSKNAFQGQIDALKRTKDNVAIGSAEYKKLSAAIRETERDMKRLTAAGGGGRFGGAFGKMSVGAQAAGGAAIGAAASRFLPAGAATGASIGAIAGGAPGAIAGAAIGGTIDAVAGAASFAADSASYAAEIQKLQIALKGVTKTGADFNKGLDIISTTSKRLNVPIAASTKQFTTLSASVLGAGGTIDQAEKVFVGVSEAIKATGGNAEDVQSAIRAMSQIFGKGKVSAEELQGQLGERLAGAVVKFAEANGSSLQKLQKDLRDGTVGLDQVIKFAEKLQVDFGKTAEEVANSSADAGQRLKTTMDRLRLAVGTILQPIGAEFQRVFANIVGAITDAIEAFNKFMGIGLGNAIAKTEKNIASLNERIANSTDDRVIKRLNQQLDKALARLAKLQGDQAETEGGEGGEGGEGLPSLGDENKSPLKSFADSAFKFAEQAEQAVVNAFKGMEDALVKFVMTGKLNFSDLARSIIADLTRMLVRAAIVKPLFSFLFPNLANGGVVNAGEIVPSANGNVFAKNKIVPYAYGGIVNKPTLFPMANGMGLMGEAGPEAIMPLKRGRGGKLGVEASGGVGSIVVNVDASGTSVEGDQQQGQELGRLISAAVQSEIIQQQRPGGLLA
tara:strand:+ start:180 stop:2201 length:2022 start_codon:yes stop_codon:yes gene_type:complete